MSVGLIVALVGLVVAAILIAVGIARVVTAGRALKIRIDGYAALPIFRTYDETRGRVFLAQRAVANAPALVTRLEDALETLAFARARLALAASQALVAARRIPAVFLGLA